MFGRVLVGTGVLALTILRGLGLQRFEGLCQRFGFVDERGVLAGLMLRVEGYPKP